MAQNASRSSSAEKLPPKKTKTTTKTSTAKKGQTKKKTSAQTKAAPKKSEAKPAAEPKKQLSPYTNEIIGISFLGVGAILIAFMFADSDSKTLPAASKAGYSFANWKVTTAAGTWSISRSISGAGGKVGS